MNRSRNSQEVIDEVRQRINIVDVISERVQLKRSGRGLVGLCPFHTEKSPSFNVNESEGFYHCFGCGKSGSVFDFVMETRSFSFPEALKYLAGRAGVKLPEPEGIDRALDEKQERRRKLLKLIPRLAARVFEQELSRDAAAKNYLHGRGISDETIAHFHLGYAPAAWEFIGPKIHTLLEAESVAVESEDFETLLIESGLTRRRDSGSGTYDVFRDRVIFPICRSDDHPIAFGARLMAAKSDAPKYLNSPETPVYSKRRSLFGIPQAMPGLRQSREIVLVEGYMDVIGLHQAGLVGALATCGTAVTPDHATLLRRLGDRVLVVFDADAAGKKAAVSCFEIFLNSGLAVSVVELPEGHDPDSLAREKGGDQIRELFQKTAVPIERFFLDQLMASHNSDDGDVQQPVLVGKAAEKYAGLVARVKNPVEREALVRLGADRLGVSFESISSLAGHAARASQAARAADSRGNRPQPASGRSQTSSGSAQADDPNSGLDGFDVLSNDSGSSPVSRPRSSQYDRSSGGTGFSGGTGSSGGTGFGGSPYAQSRGAQTRSAQDRYARRAQPEQDSANPAQTPGRVPIFRSGGSLERYARHLMIAVISEPRLARTVVEMPSLVSEGAMAGALPAEVRGFLEEVARADAQSGLSAPQDDPSVLTWFAQLLPKFGLEALGLLEEVQKQLARGGTSPDQIIGEADIAEARMSLGAAIEQLRHAELDGQKPSDALERIAQEKLLKRRQLEGIRGLRK